MERPVSRREFGRVVASAIPGLALAKASFADVLAQVSGRPGGGPDDEAFWTELRGQIMTPNGYAYMNSARLSPTPKPIYDNLVEYWRLMAVSPSENSSVYEQGQEAVRLKAASFVGASPDEIAIVRNTTEGLVTVINGLDLEAGDEIIHSFHEHSSNLQPWKLRAQRHGVVLKEVPIPTPPDDPAEILTLFEDAITPRTRVITLAHCTTVTGGFTPVKELTALARSRGILCLVDGAHPLGQVQYDLHELGVDSYASPAHKWLGAPAGTGILYVRAELVDRIWPNIVTQSWYQDVGARKYDRLSRRPWPQVELLGDAIDYQLAIGRDRIERRIRALGTYLRSKAAEIPGVTLYTSNDPRLSAGMTTLSVGSLTGDIVHEHLLNRHNVYTSPRSRGPVYPADPAGFDGVRISTAYFNSFDEVDLVLEGLGELASRSA